MKTKFVFKNTPVALHTLTTITPNSEHDEKRGFIHKDYLNHEDTSRRYNGSSQKKRFPNNINNMANNVLNMEHLVKSEGKGSLYILRNDYKPYITKRKIESTLDENFRKSSSLSKLRRKSLKNDTSFDNPLRTIRNDHKEINDFTSNLNDKSSDYIKDYIQSKFTNIISQKSVKAASGRNINTKISSTEKPKPDTHEKYEKYLINTHKNIETTENSNDKIQNTDNSYANKTIDNICKEETNENNKTTNARTHTDVKTPNMLDNSLQNHINSIEQSVPNTENSKSEKEYKTPSKTSLLVIR